jgi:secretory phospholipase A2
MLSRLPLAILFVLALAVALCSACDRPTCRTGTYVSNPNFVASGGGCGSYGISIDAPFGANSCCDQHDICYHTCTASKDSCDDAFDTCMQNSCDDEDDLEKVACRVQAEVFYKAVMELGCRAYQGDQEDACQCSDGSNVVSADDSSSAPATRAALAAAIASLINM